MKVTCSNGGVSLHSLGASLWKVMSGRGMAVFVAKSLLGFCILFLVFRDVEWDELSNNIGRLSFPLFFILLLLSVCDRFIMGFKWNLLLRANGVNVSTLRVVSLYIVSNLLGVFTPGNLGGDAYRVVSLSKMGQNQAVLSTVLLERALGGVAYLLFIIFALPFSFSFYGENAEVVATVSVVGTLLLLLLIFLPGWPPFRERVEKYIVARPGKMANEIHRYFCAFASQNRNRRVLSVFFVLTVAETAFFFFLNFLAARAAGIEVSLAFIFVVIPVVHFILRLPITIQGIGLQEGLFAYALGLAGFPVAQGVVVSLLWRLKNILAVYLPGSLLLLLAPAAVVIKSDPFSTGGGRTVVCPPDAEIR